MCLLFAFLLQRELFLPVRVWDYIIKKDHSEKKILITAGEAMPSYTSTSTFDHISLTLE